MEKLKILSKHTIELVLIIISIIGLFLLYRFCFGFIAACIVVGIQLSIAVWAIWKIIHSPNIE